MQQSLMRPSAYQRRRAEEFRTYSALRHYLTNRHSNGLVESGAVVETPLGLRINPERMDRWLGGEGHKATA